MPQRRVREARRRSRASRSRAFPATRSQGASTRSAPNVTAWKNGERVGVGWHGGHCFECDACRAGLFINCEKAKITGISYDGGYAEYVVVPAESVARIPEGLDGRRRRAAPLRRRHDLQRAPQQRRAPGRHRRRAGHRRPRPPRHPVRREDGLPHRRHLERRRQGGARARSSARTSTSTRRRSPRPRACRSSAAPTSSSRPRRTARRSRAPSTGSSRAASCSSSRRRSSRSQVPAFGLLSGKSVAGWPSGSAIDSEDTMAFSALTGVRPRIEKFKLEQAEAGVRQHDGGTGEVSGGTRAVTRMRRGRSERGTP